MRKPLLVKPLQDHLSGLLRKLERLDDARIVQAMIDCVLFIMIEGERIDQTGGQL